MKKLILFLSFYFFILMNGFCQKTPMAFDTEKKNKIESAAKKNNKIKAQLKKLPPQSQDKFLETLAIFYSLKGQDRKSTLTLCFECMESKKQINSNEKMVLKKLAVKRKFKKKFLNQIKTKQKFSTELAKTLISLHLNFILNNSTEEDEETVSTRNSRGQEFWSNAGRTLGYILGASSCGSPCAQIGGALGEGLITVVDSDTTEEGTDPDKDNDEDTSSGNDNNGVVLRGDGKDCQGFPFHFE